MVKTTRASQGTSHGQVPTTPPSLSWSSDDRTRLGRAWAWTRKLLRLRQGFSRGPNS